MTVKATTFCELRQLLEEITSNQSAPLPFALYQASTLQQLRNLRLINPVLMLVLNGRKEIELGSGHLLVLNEGEAVVLSSGQSIFVRNIPKAGNYSAFIMEFTPEDKPTGLVSRSVTEHNPVFSSQKLILLLKQLVEWAALSPTGSFELRRQEILTILGSETTLDIPMLWHEQSLSDRIQRFLKTEDGQQACAASIARFVGLSESTLRRRLKAEKVSLQQLKDEVRLGLGLHLLQSTKLSILHIAMECGYHSQSRFSERFKELFGMSPSEVRKNELIEKGEKLALKGQRVA